jgi:hypothetical protein
MLSGPTHERGLIPGHKNAGLFSDDEISELENENDLVETSALNTERKWLARMKYIEILNSR